MPHRSVFSMTDCRIFVEVNVECVDDVRSEKSTITQAAFRY